VSRCPSAFAAPDVDGWLPLHVAAFNITQLAVVRRLVERFPLALQHLTKEGWLPFHLASRQQQQQQQQQQSSSLSQLELELVCYLFKSCPLALGTGSCRSR
jgi:hypothetical protein